MVKKKKKEQKTEKKIRCYIAGPMSGLPNFNYDRFNEIEKQLGVVESRIVINPAKNFGGDQTKTHDEYLRVAIQQVASCDELYAIVGWRSSLGATQELMTASDLGISIFEEFENDHGYFGLKSGVLGRNDILNSFVKLRQTISNETPVEEAVRIVHGDRNKDYGDPLKDYQKTSKIWSGILYHKLKDGEEITPREAVLMMAGMKISRLVFKHKRDSVTDTHGYMLLYDMLHEDSSK